MSKLLLQVRTAALGPGLLSWIRIGAPPKPFMRITLLELLGAPAFISWRPRVAGALGA
jgi:hypothetical protein